MNVLILDMRPRPDKRRARMKSAAKRRASALLMAAQGGVCAHCEEPFPLTWASGDADDAPTLDHVHPRVAGGSNELSNLLLKHRACNMAGGSRLPSRRDRKWQAIVAAYLASRPAPHCNI